MAKASEVAFLGGVLGTLLLATTARADDGSLRRRASGTPSAAELATGACRLDRWAAAADLLRVVAPEDRSAEAWLCLARAQVALGLWVEALDSYDELTERPATTPRARNARRAGGFEREALEARLAWLRVMASDLPAGDTQLTLDGQPIARGRLGVEFPVQPGQRSIAVEGHGVTQTLANVALREGEHRSLALVVPLEPRIGRVHGKPLVAAAAANAPAAEGDYARWSRRALYGGALVTGAGLTLLAASSSAGSDASSFRVVGFGGLFLGGLSFMGAGVLRLIGDSAPSEKEAPPQPHVEPWVSATGAGVAGSF